MLTTLCLLFTVVSTPEQDFSALTSGVRTVAKPGTPGVVSAISPSSVPILLTREGGGLLPVASAGHLDRGRIVAFGHGAYFSEASVKVGDTRRLLINAIRWASRRESQIRVGYLQPEDRSWITGLGFDAVHLNQLTLGADLYKVDVAVIQARPDRGAIEEYVRKGGGLLTGHTPWGWLQLNPGRDLATEMPMQSLLHKAGLSFSDGTAGEVWPAKDFAEAAQANANGALQRIQQDGKQASVVLLAALRSTPETVPIHAEIRSAIKLATEVVPTSRTPITGKDSLAKLAIAVRQLDREAGKKIMKFEPSALDFPGAVPLSADRVQVKLTLPVDRRQWVSTGLYAAPGEEVIVESATAMAGVNVQIGCHSDKLWHLDKWERHPEITTRTVLIPGRTRITSPFGGLIYISVDRAQSLPPQQITFNHVVRSARYVHGETTLDEWKKQLEHSAPWAEIGSDKIIFSVPIEHARNVADPVSLMKLWDRCMDLISDLDGRPLLNRPERIVCDRQISAGYMHSGYPIMTWMDKSIELSLSVPQLTSAGTWGHWHELGHNRQKGEWTFSGTGEVTNNLYSLYLMEKVAGRPIWDRIGNERKKVEAYLAKGGDFAEWKREPFLALTMYAQLIEAFGWDSVKKYLRSYEGPNAGTMPRNDDEKRDQFLIRYSKVVGRNLGPFFRAWGIPTSAGAQSSVANLPTWMPNR